MLAYAIPSMCQTRIQSMWGSIDRVQVQHVWQRACGASFTYLQFEKESRWARMKQIEQYKADPKVHNATTQCIHKA